MHLSLCEAQPCCCAHIADQCSRPGSEVAIRTSEQEYHCSPHCWNVARQGLTIHNGRRQAQPDAAPGAGPGPGRRRPAAAQAPGAHGERRPVRSRRPFTPSTRVVSRNDAILRPFARRRPQQQPGILRFYAEETPGLKIGPTTVTRPRRFHRNSFPVASMASTLTQRTRRFW